MAAILGLVDEVLLRGLGYKTGCTELPQYQ